LGGHLEFALKYDGTNLAILAGVYKRRQDLLPVQGLPPRTFPILLALITFVRHFFSLANLRNITRAHVLHRHFEHRSNLARLFMVDQKLFGQKVGIIAKWQCTADPATFAFKGCPGIGYTLCNQLAFKFSESGKDVENQGVLCG
jgi:hypothetical protein